MGSLSFPPLIGQWKGAAQGRSFPGSSETWKKALAPRPLAHLPDKQTVQDLKNACGAKFNLLADTVALPEELVSRDSVSQMSFRPTRAGGTPSRKMPLYDSVWPETTPPTFSVWDYCKRVGHAVPPNHMPAPRVNDMKQWFDTYGSPSGNAPPGVRSEFASTCKSVPFGEGTPSAQVKMFRGRVLK